MKLHDSKPSSPLSQQYFDNIYIRKKYIEHDNKLTGRLF